MDRHLWRNTRDILISRVKRKTFIVTAFIITVLMFVVEDLFTETDGGGVDISCHYHHGNDGLKPLRENMPTHNQIFFHETSCKGYLNSRESCAIESALRAHPDWTVNVIFSGPVTEKSLNKGSIRVLRQYPNLQLARVHILDYAKGTPVEDLVSRGALNRSSFKIEHTSQFLRYLTLQKGGGVYLDLDVLVARPISSLARDWVARESDSSISASILAFSQDSVGRAVAEDALRELRASYAEADWRNSGSGVITRVLQRRCSTPRPSYMSAATCDGFEVYGPQFFYPIEWKNARNYFRKGDLYIQNAYTYHLWDHISKNFKVNKDSPFERLAKRYCPYTYRLYGDSFGL